MLQFEVLERNSEGIPSKIRLKGTTAEESYFVGKLQNTLLNPAAHEVWIERLGPTPKEITVPFEIKLGIGEPVTGP